jgi:hypothetical protein
MKKFFVVETPPYPFSIVFSVGQTKAGFNSSMKSMGNYDLSDIDDFFSESNAGQTCNNTEDNFVVVMLRYNSNHGAIAHEIFHAVSFIMSRAGIRLCSLTDDRICSTEEAYAYMIEYVTDKFYEKINETEC